MTYRAVYPGVDLAYYGNQRELEHDFIVAPGADPDPIKLNFEGAAHLRIDADGDLVLGTAGGELRQRRPVIYQEGANGRQAVSGRYLVEGAHQVGFQVDAYDAGRPLVVTQSEPMSQPILLKLGFVAVGWINVLVDRW